MKECPRCKTQNRDSARFCKHCSIPLVAQRFCTHCGTSNSGTAGFCRGCGKPLHTHSQNMIGLQSKPLSAEDVVQASAPGAVETSLTPQTGKLPPKTRVGGRYIILNLIGRGGMGAVYLVEDLRLGNKKCAMKEMSDSAIRDPNLRQQAIDAFRQEAQILSSLYHQGLPRVTDYFSEGEKYFLVMDFVEGKSLAELLETSQDPFPESRVLDWGDQLCDVLEYLHDQIPPIIYRDLKPENIILSTNRQQVRLIDFGTARTYKQQQGKDTAAIGTPGFAPPEQYGKTQTDARADVYALGVTLHQLLTLHDPGKKLFDIPPARSLNPDISPHIEAAIEKAVEKDLYNRWQSISEFRAALRTPVSSEIPTPKAQPAPSRISAISTASPPAVAAKVSPRSSLAPGKTSSKPRFTPVQHVAKYGPRIRAFLIDAMLLAAGLTGIALFFLDSQTDDAFIFMVLLMLLWIFGYYAYFHVRRGQTPGKKANGIKVICKDGKPPGIARALWRVFLFLVLFPVITWFVPLLHEENRTLHDILAGTWVVEA